MADMLATERTLSRDIVPAVERAVPGVEVLAVELLSPSRFCVYVDHPNGVDHALCARVTELLADYRALVHDRRLVAGSRPAASHSRPTSGLRSARTAQIRTAGDIAGKKRFRGTVVAASERSVRLAVGDDGARHPVRADRPGQPDRRGIGEVMSQEIMEGIRTIEREKGIETGHARRGARGRAPRCIQEDAGCLPSRRGDPRRRGRVPRVLDRDPCQTSRSGWSTRRARRRSTSSSASRRRPASASTRSSTTPISSSTGRRCRTT